MLTLGFQSMVAMKGQKRPFPRRTSVLLSLACNFISLCFISPFFFTSQITLDLHPQEAGVEPDYPHMTKLSVPYLSHCSVIGSLGQSRPGVVTKISPRNITFP